MCFPVLYAKQQTSVWPQGAKQVVHWSASLFLGFGTPEATTFFFSNWLSKSINFVKSCVASLAANLAFSRPGPLRVETLRSGVASPRCPEAVHPSLISS